ncbi:hypothetical protein E2C01_007026 [Portunus trituberculatus]|uniref:Uncharacterized protein n=1 Tax=Portunus trituberculatus TaxID=210409 RepID=A0A5B7D3E2_PORTR|nr:hypothetical protein [Portunus trituberculatus]
MFSTSYKAKYSHLGDSAFSFCQGVKRNCPLVPSLESREEAEAKKAAHDARQVAQSGEGRRGRREGGGCVGPPLSRSGSRSHLLGYRKFLVGESESPSNITGEKHVKGFSASTR